MRALPTLIKGMLFALPLLLMSGLSEGKQKLFALDQVSILSGPFAHAQQVNVQYVLAMQPDKLLAPYLREAGLATAVSSYGNWENTGLDGHIGGHYLSALSLAWAASGDAELRKRLDYMLNQLQGAQQANQGYLGGIPDGKAMWEEIRQGNISADLFSLNERWVPLYNIDKIFHGLRDAYLYGKSQQAKSMLLKLGEWMLAITKDLSEEQIQTMLYSEHGGLNEVFADMADISQDPRYLELARKFTHQLIVSPLTKGKDTLNGLHANTQIPKIVGMLKVADASDDKVWLQAANFFWETVTHKRSVSIGGNSVREHFHDTTDFSPMIEDAEGPETCNTYNMLKLSKLLFLQSGDTRYLDYYERATYNHILSSQHPDHGGLVYFTSMRPGHYRMYSSVQDSMWCCVGSGIENHSKYGELIYSHNNNSLFVNLFVPSTLNWADKGVNVTQHTAFPDDESVSIVLNTRHSLPTGSFDLFIRQPRWLKAGMTVKVNQQVVDADRQGGYLRIKRNWQDRDVITFSLSADLYTEQLPDGQSYYSVLYGPVVLATRVNAFHDEKLDFVAGDSRMGHIASGPVCPPEALPMMLDDPNAFVTALQRSKGRELRFIASEHVAIARDGVANTPAQELIPFFRLHDSRYQVYWPQLNGQDFDAFMVDAKQQARAQTDLQKITLDEITPGEQQPEVEHQFKGEQSRAGVHAGKHWRDATAWFEYQLSNSKLDARRLRITYFIGDVGRQFNIKLNGQTLAQVRLPVAEKERSMSEGEFYSVDYILTEKMQRSEILSLRFEAKPQSVAGGIYGIRLLSE